MRLNLLLCAFGLVSLAAPWASAQKFEQFPDVRRLRETDQSLAIEFRFGRYYPDVDKQFPDSKPFESFFGNEDRYLVGLEVDWQALRIPRLGTFGPGFGVGYTSAAGNAFLKTGERSEQESSLSLLPMYLVGVLRADVLPREFRIPIVPYGKVGFGYALWWATDGDNLARRDSVVGSGRSYGLQWALGGMLLLDPLDTQTAKIADTALGINHSYIFAEWYNSTLDGFGASNQLRVGTHTWMLGIALEI